MNLNTISGKFQQFAVFIRDVTRSGVQLLIWATIAAVALAAASVAFRALWRATEMVFKALGI